MILTITCNRDIDVFLSQLRSFDLFLETTNVAVVINEDDNSLFNEKCLSKINNSKHKIIVNTRKEILGNVNISDGWVTQQLIKLFYPSEEYIVLDCKDILVKDTKVNDLKKEQYQDQSYNESRWKQMYEKLEEIVGTLDKTKFRNSATPRLLKKSVIDKALSNFSSKNDFINWFKNIWLPSEFILYDCFLNENLEKFGRYEIAMVWEEKHLDKLLDNPLNKSTRILKIHSRVYNDTNLKIKIHNWYRKNTGFIL